MSKEKYPAQFLAYTNIIIDHLEGGFVNHPSDPGGATNYGIIERVARANGYTGHMRDLPRDTAIAIYFKDYWDGKLMNHIKNHVAFHLYDCSINSGYSRAIKLLQRAIGVAEDGLIGANTINAISRYSESELILRFNIVRMHFYGTLKHFNTFGRGWMNRLLLLSNINWKLETDKYE